MPTNWRRGWRNSWWTPCCCHCHGGSTWSTFQSLYTIRQVSVLQRDQNRSPSTWHNCFWWWIKNRNKSCKEKMYFLINVMIKITSNKYWKKNNFEKTYTHCVWTAYANTFLDWVYESDNQELGRCYIKSYTEYNIK